jgi:uncharacterized protein YvpB
MSTLTASLNRHGRKLSQPTNWLHNFTTGCSYTTSFDGEHWAAREGEIENPDVTVLISPEAWATFLAVKRDERRRYAQTMQITGAPERVEEFLHTLGVRDEKA